MAGEGGKDIGEVYDVIEINALLGVAFTVELLFEFSKARFGHCVR